MQSEELNAEIATILGRLSTKIRTDPAMLRALARGDGNDETTLAGIEEAIIGLVMLHIQVRRGL
jgi:hypothetical protein